MASDIVDQIRSQARLNHQQVWAEGGRVYARNYRCAMAAVGKNSPTACRHDGFIWDNFSPFNGRCSSCGATIIRPSGTPRSQRNNVRQDITECVRSQCRAVRASQTQNVPGARGATKAPADSDWTLDPGDEIRRTELHERYGGSGRGGIAPSRSSPNILVFTGADSGNQHGYFDRWEGDHRLIYCGEGQTGDQELARGNLAILNHKKDGRALRVFDSARGVVRYIGEFETADNDPFTWELAPSTGGGPQRKVIMFRLQRVEAAPIGSPSRHAGSRFTQPYRRADEEVETEVRGDVRFDPDRIDRGLRAHRRIQNAVADWARVSGFDPQEPVKGGPGPEFDVGWWDGETFVVVEVKSLGRSGLPTTSQLRLGLGQVLDYEQSIADRGYPVAAVLAVEYAPETRWVEVCARHKVTLVWPGTFDRMGDRDRAGVG